MQLLLAGHQHTVSCTTCSHDSVAHASAQLLSCCLHPPPAVPHFPRTLTAGLELELVIQDVVAEPCALLLEDSDTLKVGRLNPLGCCSLVA